MDELDQHHHQQQQHSLEGGQQQEIALRAVVTTKEAGVIIGKEGRTVSGVREVTGVKVGVSKVIPRIHERTLTVSGPLPNVAKV
jgi:heterogeneous nuclear rnp K-like protein 2